MSAHHHVLSTSLLIPSGREFFGPDILHLVSVPFLTLVSYLE